MSRLALKRLTSSDLGFFEPYYRSNPSSHQKAINLNADVFVDQFYPILAQAYQEILVRLIVFGPGGAEPAQLTRSITRTPGAKNWRLNGEFVYNPDDQIARFSGFAPGDLAILDFRGDPEPNRINLLLVSANAAQDVALHHSLAPLVTPPGRSMVAIDPGRLAGLAAPAPQDHPIWEFVEDETIQADLQDAAVGGAKGEAVLVRRGAVISAEALAQARQAQEASGKIGEVLAWARIERLGREGIYSTTEWSSKTNAVSPYDFEVTEAQSGEVVRIDAKSTSLDWRQPIHMSLAEVNEAARGGRYDLWRLFEVGLGQGKLKIATDIGAFAAKIRDSLNLPEGVTVDTVSIDPEQLDWQEEGNVLMGDDEEAI